MGADDVIPRRGKRKRAQTRLERALARHPGRYGTPADARRPADDVQRVPVGPLCEWCRTPIDVSKNNAAARCRCGLP